MHISEINIYPIKSLKGISLDSAKVEERGLEFDRRWMLTTPDGMFFAQREFPRMATLSVVVESGELRVESEGQGVLSIPLEPDSGERQRVTVWQSVCDGLAYNGAVSEWFSDAIGTNCRLVYMPDASRRHINPRFDRGDDVVSFADGYPLMLIGEGSLEELNGRLETQLPMNRFRPNLVVSGSEPFAEDDWRTARIGEAMFRSTKPCERCVMTTVDQATGEFDGKDPLKTLATYRQARMVMPERIENLGLSENAVLFGQNLVCENPGATVRIDDRVEVLESF
ncbi:MAG TPA: MOSC N-terminal beta barrel domain-containing protein [Pyrinomonadaceae bacterium]|jgi:uncharacterized protein YcbX|nr:MOSC N-terminal beta barrel domain-containing protein [Pyrinomonadaceae bacterium]